VGSPVTSSSPVSAPASPDLFRLLQVRQVYAEPAALASSRGQQVLARFPGAEVVEVPSHWKIPELHGNEGNVERWVRVKSETLVLGVKKSLTARPNGRSANWIAPSTANGCAMACAYCYVPRQKGYANPITVFTNIEQITGYLRRHVARQGPKSEPDQCDPQAWVYDLGENSDCSVDALVSDNVADLVATFAELPTAKASFATKYVNRQLLELDPRGRTRIRFSVMPEDDARVLDIRTSRVAERIAAVDDFVEAGYEVHLNLSPVVLREGWEPTGRSCSAGWTTSSPPRPRRRPPPRSSCSPTTGTCTRSTSVGTPRPRSCSGGRTCSSPSAVRTAAGTCATATTSSAPA
jgi:spore photoproduct lyase family protein